MNDIADLANVTVNLMVAHASGFASYHILCAFQRVAKDKVLYTHPRQHIAQELSWMKCSKHHTDILQCYDFIIQTVFIKKRERSF